MQELLREAQGFDSRIADLEERYLHPALLEARHELESRFNDARVAHFLGDYVKASIMFVSVVDNPRARQFSSYRDALYHLGDSLFQMRSYRAGREYFRQVVELGPGSYYQASIVRLLEIASLTNDYDGVDDLFRRLDSQAQISPTLAYIRGKTLYGQQKFDEARTWFQRAALDRDYAFLARYYEGILYAAQGQLEPAHSAFAEVAAMTPSKPEQAHVIDLANLALGRLAYEEGDFDQAIDFYLQLPRTSASFDRALYELTWALISKENYRAARRNIDILLLSNPHPSFVPEAKLLMADLAMKIGDYEDARHSYQDVIETFTPIKQELDDFIASHDNLEEFFIDLVRRDIQGLRPDYLPPLVDEWAGEEKRLLAARRLVEDGMLTQEDIDEIFAAIEEIESMLVSGTRIEAFPSLTEGMSMGIEMENHLIELHRMLLRHEHAILEGTMNSEERARWKQMERESAELERRYQEAPQTQEELRARNHAVNDEFSRLRRELDAVAYEIDTQRVHLNAIDTYLRQNPLETMSADDRRQVNQMRAELRELLQDLEQARVALQRELDLSRRHVGVGDAVAQREQGLRKRFHEVLAQRGEFLAGLHSRVGAGHRAELQSIARARQGLPGSASRLHRYFSQINALVDERVVDIRRTLDAEYQLVTQYQHELERINAGTESTAAVIAYLNFRSVGDQFDALVLRGHVGLTDVSWQKKEDTTNEINQLFEDRSSEVQLLRESFRDVR
ncbi:MAG: tetratricopeptide repeat protein [Bradymonadaceae bacterium]